MGSRSGRTVAAVMFAALLAACSGNGQSVTFLNEPLAGAEEVLVAAEGAMRAEATTKTANVADHAGCWFSYPDEEASEPNPFLRCGPVLFAESTADAPWMTYAIDFFPAGKMDWQASLGDLTEQSSRLAEGESLRRPDGREPPEAVALDVPAPPPIATDYVGELDAEALGEVTRLEEAVSLRLPGFQVEVLGVDTAKEVGSGPQRLVAPDGHQIVTVLYRPETAYSGFGDSASVLDPANYALVATADGRRVGLSHDPGWSGDSSPRGTRFVAADNADIGMTLEWEGLVAAYSFTEGAFDERPDELYREHRSVEVQKPYQDEFEAGPYNVVTVAGVVQRVNLTPYVPGLGPAGDDQTWMVVQFEHSGSRFGWEYATSPFSAQVGDRTFEAAGGASFSIRVPIDVQEVTIHMRPDIVVDDRDDPQRAQLEPLTFTVDFETGSVS